jgi:hypothetical protein
MALACAPSPFRKSRTRHGWFLGRLRTQPCLVLHSTTSDEGLFSRILNTRLAEPERQTGVRIDVQGTKLEGVRGGCVCLCRWCVHCTDGPSRTSSIWVFGRDLRHRRRQQTPQPYASYAWTRANAESEMATTLHPSAYPLPHDNLKTDCATGMIVESRVPS